MTISHPPTPGTALWLYAHPRPDSLNGRIFREGVDTLAGQRNVLTSDLYAQGFDPVLRESDLGQLSGTHGNFAELLGDAYTQGQLALDVRAEQRKVAEAELLIIQFPLWWYGMPAILKGWIDRVLTAGFAFGDLDETGLPRRYGDGGLVGRKALIIVTAGEDGRSLGSRGISGDLDTLLFPLTHGVLWYSGVASYDLHVITDADGLDDDAVARELRRLRRRLSGIAEEPARLFRNLRDGEYRGTRALRADLAPGRTDLNVHLADDRRL
ncbi:ribosyldihydronicotinamide dehydrogenase [Pseudoclavibacter endophyticus]|uniref:NAD(P)H-dependent oxidoreductase n=1 Tax=Pseudoclavibacter endophyticus TaxID=1778590 RepID=A0A6H9WNZ5_9MICO|nr:NAD(P)H-dependent oxidoreductase [Pseudoclavibacter endophyticus]KAB1646819.1 NAD(P)H-dependent oxidoreductase [Pseudoclavibacter endophyticus]GGA75271.1 ribosyldihydronicotinamide dehydrogenase [Pseudoclavibacter endophyticus]